MTVVLLVEDTPGNQVIIEDIFEFDDIPADLVIVDTGEEAIERLASIDPALILMDIGLPGMSGLEAVRLIKADPARCHTAIWALTAHAMQDMREEAIAAGCVEYVTKPIVSKSLSRRIREFIELHEGSRAV